MADLATVGDVENNWRSLRGNEMVVAPTWLSAASAELRFMVPGLDARVAADNVLPAADRTGLGEVLRDKVAFVVRHRLRGADPTDRAVDPYDSFWFGKEWLAALRAGGATVNRSSGSFRLGNPFVPATCVTPTYPMF